MIMQNLECWAKACYEYTDFGTNASVSVVTNGFSDDANGCNLEGNTVWLQMCRVGNNFAIHYSTDGEKFLYGEIFYTACLSNNEGWTFSSMSFGRWWKTYI